MTNPDERRARRPQLSGEELQQLKWLLGGVLTLLALGTVLYMDVDAWAVMLITAGATIATLAKPALPARVPRVAHTLAFPGIVAFFAADMWLKGEVLPAMVRLDILLLLYRNLTYRQRRDDLQLVVLGLFLVIVAGVLTVSLTFAVHLLVYTGCALALLLVITLSEGAGRAGDARAEADARRVADSVAGVAPSWAAHADWAALFRRLRGAADWRVIGMGVVLFAGVVGVSALLFLAIPRFQLENSMFLDRFISKKAKSGFSDTITFGDVTEILQDDSLALSVDVSDQGEVPASPYWRMVTLDFYDRGTFRLSPGLRRQEFLPERSYVSLVGNAKPRRGAAVWTFYLEAGVSRYLPMLGPFGVVRFREMQNFQLAPRLALVALREEPAAMTAYQVENFDTSGEIPDAAFAERWRTRTPETVGRSAMQVLLRMTDSDTAKLRAVVAELTGGGAMTARAFGARAAEWLRLRHPYSLTPVVPAGEGDPLVRWLVSREGGHCELFAGSFVVLARAAGFPARVVTGFRGGTWNGYSNNFTIRNADAHAWAEIFDEATGAWVRMDPLAPPAESRAAEVQGEGAIVSRLDRSWKARLESLRVFWYRRIVSFDQSAQLETLKAVKEVTQNTGKRVREWLTRRVEAMKAWLLQPWDLRRVAMLAALLAGAAAVVWAWREFGRGWWRRLRCERGPGGEDPVRREAGRWLGRMAECQASRCARDEGRMADRKSALEDGAERDLRAVEAELLRLRFGARATWGEPEKIFRRARAATRNARRRNRRER